MASVRRAEVKPDCVKINLSQSRLDALITSTSTEWEAEKHKPVDSSDRVLTLTAPCHLKRVTAAFVNGRQPPQLNAMKLMRLTAHRAFAFFRRCYR